MGRSRELADLGELATAYDSGNPLGMRNRIINGDMRIDQRNDGAAVTINSSTSVYTVDRWAARGVNSAGVYTLQKSTVAPLGFSNSLLATVTTQDVSLSSGDQYTITHRIEGFNVADLKWFTGSFYPAPVTLSFWVRSSITGAFGGSIANNNIDRCYPFEYTINAANTWEQKFITISDGPGGTWLTNNGIGIFLSLSIGAGSAFQGGANNWRTSYYTTSFGQTNLMATNGATFYLTGVQLEAGSVATPFERRPYGTELALCQRYYQTGVAHLTVYTITGNFFEYRKSFPVTMRAAPTIGFTSTSFVNANTIFASAGVSDASFRATATASAPVSFLTNYTASIEL